MRFLVRVLAMASIVAVIAPPVSARQEGDPAHKAAYERWRAAVEAHPLLPNPHWYRTDEAGSPKELIEAINAVVSYGPNMVPFLVEEVRRETNHMRLYRLLGLLHRVAGIDVGFDIRSRTISDYWPAVPTLKARLLDQWDGGSFEKATAILRATWKEPRLKADGSVDLATMAPVLRLGVFAIPFIAEKLESEDSPTLFAAFLNATYQMDLYTEFYKKPAKSFSTHVQKSSKVKQWARENGHRVDRLKGLHERIAALAAK